MVPRERPLVCHAWASQEAPMRGKMLSLIKIVWENYAWRVDRTKKFQILGVSVWQTDQVASQSLLPIYRIDLGLSMADSRRPMVKPRNRFAYLSPSCVGPSQYMTLILRHWEKSIFVINKHRLASPISSACTMTVMTNEQQVVYSLLFYSNIPRKVMNE